MIGAAVALASRTMAIFPLKPRDKIPLTEHGCLDASTDLEQVRAWWSKYPDANIGLATGARSGVWVVDIDGELGEASLRALEQRMGALPDTVEVITGSSGRHLYFRLPDALTIKNSARKLGEGLDTRGEGGYVVAPPSIHPCGRAYHWSVDSAAEFADAPVWLVAKIMAPVVQLDERRPPEHWTQLAHDGAEEGERNASAASLAGYLLRLGAHPALVNELLLGWNTARNRPPLTAAEVTRVVTSIAAKEFERKGTYNG